jgi:hypothetical protein
MTDVNPVKLNFKNRDDFRSFHAQEAQSFVVIVLLYAIAIGAGAPCGLAGSCP